MEASITSKAVAAQHDLNQDFSLGVEALHPVR
jgi:hypothetical protein